MMRRVIELMRWIHEPPPPTRPDTVVLLILLTLPLFAGGPWTQPAQRGFLQLSYTFIPEYRSLYTNESGRDAILLNRKVRDRTLALYAEYGLNERTTAIAIIPVKFVESGAERFAGDFPGTVLDPGSLSGVGNVSAGIRYGLLPGTVRIAALLLIDANTAESEAGTGLRTGHSAWSISPAISIGTSHDAVYGYIDAGVRLRSDDYSNEVLINSEVGARLFSRLLLIAVLDVRVAITDGTREDGNARQTGLYPDNQEYVSPGIKVIYEISSAWGIAFSRFGAFSGNLVAKSPSNTLGLYWRW